MNRMKKVTENFVGHHLDLANVNSLDSSHCGGNIVTNPFNVLHYCTKASVLCACIESLNKISTYVTVKIRFDFLPINEFSRSGLLSQSTKTSKVAVFAHCVILLHRFVCQEGTNCKSRNVKFLTI